MFSDCTGDSWRGSISFSLFAIDGSASVATKPSYICSFLFLSYFLEDPSLPVLLALPAITSNQDCNGIHTMEVFSSHIADKAISSTIIFAQVIKNRQ